MFHVEHFAKAPGKRIIQVRTVIVFHVEHS